MPECDCVPDTPLAERTRRGDDRRRQRRLSARARRSMRVPRGRQSPTARSPRRASSSAAPTRSSDDKDEAARSRGAHARRRGGGTHRVPASSEPSRRERHARRRDRRRVSRRARARARDRDPRVANGDFELAEEAVQDAFEAALARWPVEGVPDEPRGWLVTVARNKAIDTIRRRVKLREIVADRRRRRGRPRARTRPAVGDDRLRLIFTCCHPALAPEAQVALTLRTLGGLTTEEIARAFLDRAGDDGAAARAREDARSATRSIPYEVPEASELPERARRGDGACVYLIFNEGYAATAGDAWLRRDLCGEAIRLGRLLVELDARRSPKPRGLLALMLLHDARRDARTDDAGDVVLLEDQDRARWDRAQIDEALALVPVALRGWRAAPVRARRPRSRRCTARRARAADTDWAQIAALFDELLRRAAVADRRAQPRRRDRDGATARPSALAARRRAARRARRLSPVARHARRPAAPARPDDGGGGRVSRGARESGERAGAEVSGEEAEVGGGSVIEYVYETRTRLSLLYRVSFRYSLMCRIAARESPV